ncbi:MFS transporter [Veillonella montpellierensis]|uniref:MFS transporter n=1 Tax=Veillonella montpellierensis TaxID=187328 RepID=UPI00041CD280|nr:MFS transporter [Veillonella montpellierensis]
MTTTKESLWTRSFILDTIINLFVFLIFYMLMVIIAIIAKDDFHASPSQAGLAVGMFIIGTVVSRIMTGRFIGTIGCKNILYGGLGLYLVSTILYLYAPNLLILDMVRFLNGFAYGVTSTATSTIISTIVPKSRRGEGISYYGLSTSLAAAIGPFLGIFLFHTLGFNVIIYLAVALVIPCLIAACLLSYEETPRTTTLGTSKKFQLSDYVEPRINAITLISTLVGLAYSSIIGFIASYTREINMIEAGTLFFIVYAVTTAITRPVLGKLFDKKGENFILYPSFILFAIGLVLLAYASSSWMILASAVLVGLGYGSYMSNGQAIVVKIVPYHRIGMATSTYFIALDVGVGIGPYLLGGVKEIVGFTYMFLVTAAIAMLAFLAYHFLYGRLIGTPNDPALFAQKEEIQYRNAQGHMELEHTTLD